MKILFIENKYKTYFWDAIALRLEKLGFEIHWLVQNKYFKPKSGIAHVIPLPSKSDLIYDASFSEIEQKDRYSYIYGCVPYHYSYYCRRIDTLISNLKPIITFGESTLFHELLAIDVCRQLDIPYLHPTTCRYPNGRFSFYAYGSLEPFKGSGEEWCDERLTTVIDQIVNRQVVPDYMIRRRKLSAIKYRWRRVKGLIGSLVSAHIFSEVYNTPEVQKKIKIEKKRRRAVKAYESIALGEVTNEPVRKTMVYPLQMQPEANIDVWGYPYNNQSSIVEQLARRLGPRWQILVKPNPKSKYEITEELVSVVSRCSNVSALSHSVSMADVFSQYHYFFSVTGTINHECLFGGKKCFSPALPLVRDFASACFVLPQAEDCEIADRQSRCDALELIRYLVKSSYSGKIGDGIHTPDVFENENLKYVLEAFLAFINAVLNQSKH